MLSILQNFAPKSTTFVMLLTDLTLSWGSLSIGDPLDLYSNALDNKSAVNDS